MTSLDIELTERCNNNCLHCCINQPEQNRRCREMELPAAAWKDLLVQAAALGVIRIRLTGGEPLLRKDFAELYTFTRRLGIRILLFTNARLITPHLADLFVSIPPGEDIEVTAYGLSAGTYETVSRKRGSYAEYIRGLQLLLDQKIPFYIKGALWPPSADQIAELKHWTHEIMRISTPPSNLLFLDLRHRRDSNARNRQIEKMRLSPQEAIRILAGNPSEYRADLMRLCRYIAGKPTALLFTCNAGNRLCIDAYGRIQYCLALRHPDTVVDSRSHSISYYLNEFLPELRKIRATNPEFLRRCARCMLRGLCEQCPAKSWIEHGVLDQPVEYCCEIAHAQARWLGILKEDEYGWEVRDWPERVRRLEEKTAGS